MHCYRVLAQDKELAIWHGRMNPVHVGELVVIEKVAYRITGVMHAEEDQFSVVVVAPMGEQP